MISIELWRARIGQFNAKCLSGRNVFCFSFLFYSYSGSRRRKNDVSSQEKDLEPLVSTAISPPSPGDEGLITDTLPDPAPPPLQAPVPSTSSHASSCSSTSISSCSSTLLSLLPSSYSSGVLQCRSVLREALIILMIAIISQQLLLSAGDVEINPGPLASDRPHSHELISLKKDDGSKLEVTKWISAHEEWDCVDFAEMLLRNDVLVKEYRNEHKRKYNFVRAVLKDWLSRDDDDPSDTAVPRTWAALAECVTDAGLDGALAKAIRDTCPSGFSVEQCSMIEVLVDSDVPESLHSLMGDYSCMLMVLQTAELSQKKLHKLKLFLSGFCDDMALKSCTSLELVVERLVKNLKIYIFNIDTLTACHKHQLIQCDMSQVVLQYKKQLDDFFSSTSVKQLQHSLHTKVTNPNLEPITLKLNETANVDTLNKLKKLIYHIFGNTSKALILHKVRPGCVCVTWCVPTSLVPTLREKAEQLSPQYLASKGVLEVVIGLRIAPNEGHDRHSGIGEEQQAIHSSNMMIATIMKRTEIELEAVQNEKSVYEQKCDKLEEKCDKLGEELEEVAKKKVDAEVKFEELEREVQRCKKREQQLQRELDMAKRSSQAVISELEMKLQILEKELSTQQKLITAAKHYALKPQSIPDTVFVVDELKEIANDWRQLGSNLVSQHILKEIELQEDSPMKCLELLIIKWKELYPDGNPTDIITALEKMGNYKLANHLQQKYLSEVEPVAPGKPAASPSEPAVSPLKPGAASIEPVTPVEFSDGNPSKSNEEKASTYTKLVQRAMREGSTKVLVVKVLIIGPPGVGKTGIRYLLLGLPPPPRRTSTPLATRTTRAISFYRIKADGSRDITWVELDDDTYLKYIAEEVKMIELNPSRAVPPQPATSTTPAATGSSAQEPSDVDHTPPVLSPATPLVSTSSSEENVKDANPPVPPKVEGIASDIVDKLVSDPELSRNSTNKKTFVHLIDTGGQPSFISLIPAFVRGSTVIIVASKLNHSINDKLQYEYVKDDQHLVRQPTKLEKSQLDGIEELVRTFSSVKHSEEGSTQGSSEPKFLLVGTHADKHWSLFDETLSGKNRWLKKSLGELKSMCIEVSDDGDILLPINTRVTKDRHEVASSIRQKIIDACSDAEVDIRTRWYVFELGVSGKAKKEGRSVLGLAECIEIGENLSMGEEDVMAALVFLDGAALCLYFPAAAPHLVFTDPQTILSEVTEILILGIIDLHLIPSQYPLLSEHMKLVRRLRDQGLFNKMLVDIVCSKYRVNEEGRCSYSVDDFLVILKHLLIIAPVCIDGVELFFIPTILPTCSKKISPIAGKLAPLVLLCRTRVIPLGMFSALVVALLFNELFLLDEILGHNAVSLKCKLGGVVQLVEYLAWLTVDYNGHPSAAPRIRAAIHHAIATVCRQRHLDTEQIAFTDGFFCPFKRCESIPHHCEVSSSFPHWLTCSVIPKVASGPCSDEGMLAWLAEPDASTVASATAQSPSFLSSPPTGTDTVSQFQFMEAVASKIPGKWRNVGISLGISSSVLDDIERHRRGDCLECFNDVFTYWQQQSTPQSPANWATLVTLLRSNYVGEAKLADTIQNTFL